MASDSDDEQVIHSFDIPPWVSSSQEISDFIGGIPPDLAPLVQDLIVLKHREEINYLRAEKTKSTFAIWRKDNELDKTKLHKTSWKDLSIPVEDQGPHRRCWSVSSCANISDARYIHKLDSVYTNYSHQYLMDFTSPDKARRFYETYKERHYCYGHSSYKGLVYAMNHGIPARTDWTGTGCGTDPKAIDRRSLEKVQLKHVINDVRFFDDLGIALDYLRIQPILGSLAIFNPDFNTIKDGIYRGPTSTESKLCSWHSISICYIFRLNGELIALCKNTHGIDQGDGGYVFVSLEFIVAELNKRKSTHRKPMRLFRHFTYIEVRKQYEKSVSECVLYGRGRDRRGEVRHVTLSDDSASRILEGIFHSTSGGVYTNEDGSKEIIGSPTDRALLKWGVKLEENPMYTYSKSGLRVINGSAANSMRKFRGIAVINYETNLTGIHWKGDANYMLSCCTKHDSESGYIEMSDDKRTALENEIKRMTEGGLICIALAFKEVEMNDLPRGEQKLRAWEFPREELILLAIFGITNPCRLDNTEGIKQADIDFQDEADDNPGNAHLDDLVDLMDGAICPSISQEIGAVSGNQQGGESSKASKNMTESSREALVMDGGGSDTRSSVGLASALGKIQDTWDSKWDDEVMYSDVEGPNGISCEATSVVHPGEAECENAPVKGNAAQVSSTNQSVAENAFLGVQSLEEEEPNHSVNTCLLDSETPKGQECETDTLTNGTEVTSSDKLLSEEKTEDFESSFGASKDNVESETSRVSIAAVGPMVADSNADVSHAADKTGVVDLTGRENSTDSMPSSESSCAVEHYFPPVSLVLEGEDPKNERKSFTETSKDSILQTGAEACESNEEACRESSKGGLMEESSLINVTNTTETPVSHYAPDATVETANQKLPESGRTDYHRVAGGFRVIQANEIDAGDFGRLQNLMRLNITWDRFQDQLGGVNKPENASQSSSLEVALWKDQEITLEKTASWSTAKEQHKITRASSRGQEGS